MALAPQTLDDLTWQQMVDVARRRIPALSSGRWTLHAPVDPGVTLIELFAWLLEQRVFWMDQVPDATVRAILTLLGVRPERAKRAGTALELAGAAPWAELPRGTELVRERTVPPLSFSTRAGIALVPLGDKPIGLRIAGRDRTDDLVQQRAIRLLPADGGAGEATFVFWLAQPPPPNAHQPLGLFLELMVPEDLHPEWSPDAVRSVPHPAPVSYWYPSLVAGHEVRLAARDGSGGLRRSGVVRLTIPADWAPDGPPVGGLTPYAITVRTPRASFTAPPRLLRAVPNTVVAAHEKPVQVQDDVAWLPLAGHAEYELPAQAQPVLPDTVRVRMREKGLPGWHYWRVTDDLAFAGPADRALVVDRAAGVLRFGDGLTGRMPVPDRTQSPNFIVDCEIGGGDAGDGGAGMSWHVATNAAIGGVNVTPAIGGAEPETIAAVRRRAAGVLREITRAVLKSDYEALATSTPGVLLRRAYAAVGYQPRFPCTPVPGAVTVFVVPDAPRDRKSDDDSAENAFVAAPQPDPGALRVARARLQTARLVTTEVCVLGPEYRGAAIAIDVQADPADPKALRERITEALAMFLDPLTGGADGTGWPFGEPIRPSAILRAVQNALGDEGLVEKVAIGLDGAAPTESCSDVEIGPHRLVRLDSLTVRLLPIESDRLGLR